MTRSHGSNDPPSFPHTASGLHFHANEVYFTYVRKKSAPVPGQMMDINYVIRIQPTVGCLAFLRAMQSLVPISFVVNVALPSRSSARLEGK